MEEGEEGEEKGKGGNGRGRGGEGLRLLHSLSLELTAAEMARIGLFVSAGFRWHAGGGHADLGDATRREVCDDFASHVFQGTSANPSCEFGLLILSVIIRYYLYPFSLFFSFSF